MVLPAGGPKVLAPGAPGGANIYPAAPATGTSPSPQPQSQPPPPSGQPAQGPPYQQHFDPPHPQPNSQPQQTAPPVQPPTPALKRVENVRLDSLFKRVAHRLKAPVEVSEAFKRHPYTSSRDIKWLGDKRQFAEENRIPFEDVQLVCKEAERVRELRFYERHNPYYEFTNFYEAPILLDGQVWSTSEHYFQASKFIGTPDTEGQIRACILYCKRPMDVFRIARNVYGAYKRPDWEEVKEDYMIKALRAKFTQNPRLFQLLMQTHPHELVEDSPHDSYWGVGQDQNGSNKLGLALEQLREELRDEVGELNVHLVPKYPHMPEIYKPLNQDLIVTLGQVEEVASQGGGNMGRWKVPPKIPGGGKPHKQSQKLKYQGSGQGGAHSAPKGHGGPSALGAPFVQGSGGPPSHNHPQAHTGPPPAEEQGPTQQGQPQLLPPIGGGHTQTTPPPAAYGQTGQQGSPVQHTPPPQGDNHPQETAPPVAPTGPPPHTSGQPGGAASPPDAQPPQPNQTPQAPPTS